MPPHKSVLREAIQDVLSSFPKADDPELEEAMMETLSVVFECEDDETEELDIEEND